jgi:hypothetical protein
MYNKEFETEKKKKNVCYFCFSVPGILLMFLALGSPDVSFPLNLGDAFLARTWQK